MPRDHSCYWLVVLIVGGVLHYFCAIYGCYAGFYPILINTVSELFLQIQIRLEELRFKFKRLSSKELINELEEIIKDHQIIIRLIFLKGSFKFLLCLIF